MIDPMNENVRNREIILALATLLHQGQTDKGGVPYIEHVKSVGNALVSFGEEAVFTGYLHDSIEDTDATEEYFLEFGISHDVVQNVVTLSRNLYPDHLSYLEIIELIVDDGSYISRLTKLADNAHNSRSDRVIVGMPEGTKKFMRKRYSKAREILYPSIAKDDIITILKAINPELLDEVAKM